jgi:flagellar assembly protein FliH
MMALRLEVFDEPLAAASPADPGGDEQRLAIYEQGYAAGWEDAQTALAGDQNRARADLARNLQSLSFTYHEARGHILRALAPLMETVVSRILPDIAREALPSTVLETLMNAAEDIVDAPVTIVLNPASRPAVETLLSQATGLPVTLRDEPTLAEGQVYIRLGDSETQVDLDRAVSEVAAAVRNFFTLENGA